MFWEALGMTILTVIAIASLGYLVHSFVRATDKYPWLIFVYLGALAFVAILLAWMEFLRKGG